MNPLYNLKPDVWDWYDTIQTISLFQGAFILGLIAVVLHRYFTCGMPVTFYKTKHILSIAGSYVILMMLILRKLMIGVFTPTYPFWWPALVALSVAFFLADYSLLSMLAHMRYEHVHTEKYHGPATSH